MTAPIRLMLAGLLVACSSEAPPQPNKASTRETTALEADRAEVLATFEAYRGALLAKDGKRTLALVDRGTIDIYDRLLGQVRTVDRAGLARLDWIGKMTVLLARHELEAAALAGMTGESLFVTAVERGWIDAEGVREIKVAGVEVTGQVAGLSLAQAPGVPVFHFVKEAGAWKIALARSFVMIEPIMQKLFVESGEKDETAWLIGIVEAMSPRSFDRARLDGPPR